MIKTDMIKIFVFIYLTAGRFKIDGNMSFPGLENGLKRPPLPNETAVVLEALLYPPHAVIMRLHGRDSYIVVLTSETADFLGL